MKTWQTKKIMEAKHSITLSTINKVPLSSRMEDVLFKSPTAASLSASAVARRNGECQIYVTGGGTHSILTDWSSHRRLLKPLNSSPFRQRRNLPQAKRSGNKKKMSSTREHLLFYIEAKPKSYSAFSSVAASSAGFSSSVKSSKFLSISIWYQANTFFISDG